MATTQVVQNRFKDLPLEEVPCFLCGGEQGRVLVHDEPFLVRRCSGCGLGYTSPRIDGSRIHEIYDHTYWNSESAKDFGYASYEDDVAGYKATFRLKLKALRKHVPASGRLLEIGCAAGYFLDAAREKGYEVTGVDVSSSILQAARERFGLEDLHAGLLHEVGLPHEHFDIVAMWDVIEHVSDPVDVLRQCREHLAAEGRLVLQTQDVSSLTRKVLGAKWHHFKQLEHIYHFSPTTIRTLLDRAGFELVHWTRRRAGKYVSFHFLAERARRFGKIPGLLARPLDLLGRRFLYVNPFDEMIVVARRKD
jgi:2-polyprenyl-3-methyl-5-hydroxy-6-metoxy-1,4-benzoquinol methylase